MNRRHFLTMAGALIAAGMTHLAAPGLAAAKSTTPTIRHKLYRGTRDGKLFESIDGGKKWQQVASFGAHCTVKEIMTRRDGSLAINLACVGHTFDLYSQDARVWRTA